jgi:N-methylhydantoinase A
MGVSSSSVCDLATWGKHTVKVPLPAAKIGPELMPEILERFHRLHEHSYTFRLESPVELVNYHLTVLGKVKKPSLKPSNGRVGSREPALRGSRLVNFDEPGFQRSDIFRRDQLPIQVAIQSPAVIEEPDSTTVVFPDQQATRDEYGVLQY